MGSRISRLCAFTGVRHSSSRVPRPDGSAASSVSTSKVRVEVQNKADPVPEKTFPKSLNNNPVTGVSAPSRPFGTSAEVKTVMACHVKARCEVYPRSDVKRFPVPDDKVSWDVEWPEYCPVDLTTESVKKQPVWADLPDPSKIQSFNQLDGPVDRRSYIETYKIDKSGAPLNPKGRTGIVGRGCLGRWGPNHAADPVVTRWKRNEDGSVVLGSSGKPVLQFIAVQRRDNQEWALPGGMVDPGEKRTVTLKREFGEEALNSLEASDDEKQEIKRTLDTFFDGGDLIYAGYVDDPRNTDNVWMETEAYNFHDNEGNSVAKFKLHAGDDAMGVQWMDIDKNLNLYASHRDFIKLAVDKLEAHW